MPVKTAKRGDKWRVVEPGGRIAKNQANKPLDGGGHPNEAGAKRQAKAVNASLKRKGKI